MSVATTRIRWRLTRAVFRGGVFGVALALACLVASSALPWGRIVAPGGDRAAGAPSAALTHDGWVLVGLAVVALVIGGLVQSAIHEWRLRRLVASPGLVSGEDPRSARIAVLRSLPLVSAGASLASWVVGGVSLAALAAARLQLDATQAAELAAACTTVGAMLAPFRYYRVRRELPGFWAILGMPAAAAQAAPAGGRAVVSLSVKLALCVLLPLGGLVSTVAAATAHRRDLASDAAVRARLDATARLVASLVEPALQAQRGQSDAPPPSVAAIFAAIERASIRGEAALLGRSRGTLAGKTSLFEPQRVMAALAQGEPLERVPEVLLGAARVDRVDGWIVVAEPARRGSAWSALLEPRLAWLAVLGMAGALGLAWLIASDLQAGLEGIRAHLDALEPGVTAAVDRRGERFGDDELVELEGQVVELAARVRRARLRRERRRGELEEMAVRVEGRWREASQAVAGEVELAMRVRRAAEGLVEVVRNIEQLWGQLERELARQDQMSAAAARSIDGAIEACDRLADGSADTAARVGRLVATIRPLLDDVQRVRATAEVLAGAAGGGEDLHRALGQQCRVAVDACARTIALGRGAEGALATGADGVDRVRVAVGDVGQSVHRIEEGVTVLAQGFRVLEEIADRSALLAVNAAIVAARSTSAGGGFTIVADEMRDLAQRAADAVQEAVQVAGSLGRDVRGAVLAVEAVLGRLEQMAQGTRGVRSAVEGLVGAASGSHQEAARAESMASQAGADAARTRQVVDQLATVGQRMGLARTALESQIEGGGALELELRKLITDLGTGVRTSVAQTRESVQAMRRPGEVVERLDSLARALGHNVQTLEGDLRELASVSLRAQDLARLLVDDVGSALRERTEPS